MEMDSPYLNEIDMKIKRDYAYKLLNTLPGTL